MCHDNKQKVLRSTTRNKIMNSCLFAIRKVRKIKDSDDYSAHNYYVFPYMIRK